MAKNASTSFYGNIVSLSESPLVEGLIYVGTDDGLIQVTEDGGETLAEDRELPRRARPGPTCRTSRPRSTTPDTVYASFDNHKMGDFEPYVLKSSDRGRTWTSIAGDLPERGSVHTLAEDHEKPSLLFAGTEFGVFFTLDGGETWVQLEGGMPPIAVRDIDIQRRENDLVLATFGRGFYILDDYSPLRLASQDAPGGGGDALPRQEGVDVRPRPPPGPEGEVEPGALLLHRAQPALRRRLHLLPEGGDSRPARRSDARRRRRSRRKGGDVAYPSWDDLRAEAREEKPAVVLTVTDADGNVVRRLTGPGRSRASTGWPGICATRRPTRPTSRPRPSTHPTARAPKGPWRRPGTYQVSLARRVGGTLEPLGEPVTFTAEILGTASLPAADRDALLAFQQKAGRLQRAVLGTVKAAERGPDAAGPPEAGPRRHAGSRAGPGRRGPGARRSAEGPRGGVDRGQGGRRGTRSRRRMSIASRARSTVSWNSTSAPTGTQRRAYEIACRAVRRGPGQPALSGERPRDPRERRPRRPAPRGPRGACRPGHRSRSPGPPASGREDTPRSSSTPSGWPRSSRAHLR